MNSWIEFLKARNAVLEAASSAVDAPVRVARFGDLATELAAATQGAVVCPLLDWVGVSITGADAESFLQGQFTNDVGALRPGAVQLSGYCSPKGRLLANFPLASVAPNEYVLVVPADIAAGFVRKLRMFVLRAKVVVDPLDGSALIGSFDPNRPVSGATTKDEHGGMTTIGLPDGRTITLCDASNAPSVWDAMSASATPAGSPVWDAFAIRAGAPVVTAPTQDRFVPQMLNWELLGGVSFRKGCYTGQEIVARMQYLGRLKERLYRAHTTAEHVVPGDSLYGEQFGAQSCGTIVNAASSATGGTDVLAVLQTASAERDVIRLTRDVDAATLELRPLPYDVPALVTAQGG